MELTGGNNDTVEEMKLWLLKQKQTQQWNSPVATADAVYALLMKGVNLLDNQGDVRIVIAKRCWKLSLQVRLPYRDWAISNARLHRRM